MSPARKPATLQEIRNELVEQVNDLLLQHKFARAAGSGWSGLPADIASLSEALVTIDRRLSEKRGRS